MKAPPAGEGKGRPADFRPGSFDPLLRGLQVVSVQDDQRPARAHRLTRGEATRQPAIAELGVGRPVVGERPAEYTAIEGLAP